MKLKEYFESIGKSQLDDIDKMDIYEKFLNKKIEKSLTKRLYFYVKIWVFTIFFVFLFYLISPSFLNFDNKRVSLEKISTGLYVNNIEKKSHSNEVFANNVWKILELKWDIYLLNSGDKKKISDNIVVNREIYLSSNSKLKFLVESWTYVEIIWPAKFVIESFGQIGNEKVYLLNLIEGKYIKIQSRNDSNSNVVVKVDDIEIENKDTSMVNYELRVSGEKKVINNKWDQLIIKKKYSDKNIVKIIPSSKKVEITTSNIRDKNWKESNISNKKEKDNAVTYTWWYEDINLTVKIVPSASQLRSLSSLFYKTFFEKTLIDLINVYISSDEKKINIAIYNLTQKILKIYNSFGIELPSSTITYKVEKNKVLSLDELYFMLDNLIISFEKNYYIPDDYMKKMKILQSWLYFLKTKVDNIKGNKELRWKSLEDILEYFNIKDKYKKVMLDF